MPWTTCPATGHKEDCVRGCKFGVECLVLKEQRDGTRARSLSEHQPPPKASEHPACWDLAMADIRQRDEYGEKKYGVRLTPFNGRNFAVDAYQESLDLVVYLRGLIYEQEHNEKHGHTWEGGVRDCIKIVEWRLRLASTTPPVLPGMTEPMTKPNPAFVAALEEVLIFLRAMLERGTSRDPIPVASGE